MRAGRLQLEPPIGLFSIRLMQSAAGALGRSLFISPFRPDFPSQVSHNKCPPAQVNMLVSRLLKRALPRQGTVPLAGLHSL